MIVCRKCGFGCACTNQEELNDCPHCDPSAWRIMTITPGNAYSSSITIAIRQSPFDVSGRCFQTPKGVIIPLAQWRAYKETNMWKKIHAQRGRRKLFEEDVPPRVVPSSEAQA
ncbi:MAG: hypothetical protein HY291_02275 [Planctomycetes bacterium]|nr:hypothetical protein [Planctomycetota bacterium]